MLKKELTHVHLKKKKTRKMMREVTIPTIKKKKINTNKKGSRNDSG